MIIGVLTVRDSQFHPNARLMEAARERGHQVCLINPYELIPETGIGLKLAPRPAVVLPRQGSPMGAYGFVILRALMDLGIPLVNDLNAVAVARHQYRTLQALERVGLPMPRSCFLTRKDGLEAAAKTLGGWPLVMKQPSGMGGDGVVKVENLDQAEAFMDAHPLPKQGMVIQEFLEPEGRMDLRVLVVGGRVAGAMALTPSGGDFRANVHQSGEARALTLKPQWEAMALQATRACGLDIAWVDMMIPQSGPPRVSEVNYSPGFRGLEGATGLDIAGEIVEFAVERARALKP